MRLKFRREITKKNTWKTAKREGFSGAWFYKIGVALHFLPAGIYVTSVTTHLITSVFSAFSGVSRVLRHQTSGERTGDKGRSRSWGGAVVIK